MKLTFTKTNSMKNYLLFLVFFVSYGSIFAQETNQEINYCDGEIMDFVEFEPLFPGGQEGLEHYLDSMIVYPKDAIEAGAEGTVYVQFVVNIDGSICAVQVLKGVFPSLDKESKRIIMAMPNWTPGRMGETKARVHYILPIKFKL